MAARRAVFIEQAREAVRALPPDAKRKVRAAVDDLKQDPAAGEPLGGLLTGLLRARVGRYRIVYRVGSNTIEVIAIGPRRTIYIDLERQRRS